MNPIRKFLYVPLIFAVVFCIFGEIVTFFPGAEFGWFLTIAAFSAFGLFVPRRGPRWFAAALMTFSLFTAYSGYQRGIEYKKWLSSLDSNHEKAPAGERK